MLKRLRNVSNIILAFLLAVGSILTIQPSPVKADITYDYYIQFNVTDNSGIARTNVPVITGINVTSLINQGFLNAQASDNNLLASDGTVVPYTVRNDNINFVIPSLLGLETKTFYFYMTSTPLKTQYSIVLGNGGNLTVADSTNLRIGNNGSISFTGYINASINGSIISKTGEVVANITSGILTATLNTTAFSQTINITNGSVNAGDVLISTWTANDSNVVAMYPSDWTKLYGSFYSAQALRMESWYKVADGTEGSTLNISTNKSVQSTSITYRLSGNGTKSVEAATTSSGGSVSPDPPTLTPSWGTRNTTWIPVMSAERNGDWTVTAYPAGYNNGTFYHITNGAGVAAAWNTTELSATNPGVFTIDIGSFWLANTIGASTDNGSLSVASIVGSTNTGSTSITSISTSTPITTGSQTINITSSSNLTIFKDGVASNSTQLKGNVVKNTNNYTFMSENLTPYSTNITITVNSTLQAWYSPTAIVTGTVLPNLASTSNNATINFGANPTTYNISIGSVVNVLYRIPIVSNAKSFSGYLATNDLLFVAEIYNIYPPYYPYTNPRDTFQIQLIASDNTTIIAATPEQDWGDVPVSIYLNPTMVAANSVNSSNIYYLRVQANFATRVTGQITINSTDWKGTDLTQLDAWCIFTAQGMQDTNGGTGYTYKPVGGAEAITDTAGGWFTTGIPGIAQVRPNLFTTAKQKPVFTHGTDNNTFDAANWTSYVGTGIAADALVVGNIFGKTGRDMLAALIVIGVLAVVIGGTAATGGQGALSFLFISVPLLWLGTYFKIIGIQWIIVLALGFGFLAIRQFFIKTT